MHQASQCSSLIRTNGSSYRSDGQYLFLNELKPVNSPQNIEANEFIIVSDEEANHTRISD